MSRYPLPTWPGSRTIFAIFGVDAAVADGRLLKDAVDDHDVRKHYRTGADLVADFANKARKIPADAVPTVRALLHPCVVRERCRLRRLRTAAPASATPGPRRPFN